MQRILFFSVLFVYLSLFPHNSISICLIVVLIDDSSVRFANIQLSNWALFTTWAASYALPKMRKRIEQPIKLYILFLFCTKFHFDCMPLEHLFQWKCIYIFIRSTQKRQNTQFSCKLLGLFFSCHPAGCFFLLSGVIKLSHWSELKRKSNSVCRRFIEQDLTQVQKTNSNGINACIKFEIEILQLNYRKLHYSYYF